jgi:sarcosine oxidase gamma subunit
VDNSQELFAAIEVKGLTVDGIRGMHVASLRYFNPAGNFAGAVRERMGSALPQPLRADSATLGSTAVGSTTLVSTTQGGDSKFILAWRSPTETLLLSADADAFAHLKESLASEPDGCMVDQTGGLCAVRVSGGRTGDMLLRLGSGASIPAVGEARSSRLADLQVMTLCVQPGTLILLVERVYLAHLLGWMRTTAADL